MCSCAGRVFVHDVACRLDVAGLGVALHLPATAACAAVGVGVGDAQE